MAYPYAISTGYQFLAGPLNGAYTPITRCGPFLCSGAVRYAAALIATGSGVDIAVLKSLDSGQTWAEVDAAGRPSVYSVLDTGDYYAYHVEAHEDGSDIVFVYLGAASNAFIVQRFTTDAWQTPSIDGPDAFSLNGAGPTSGDFGSIVRGSDIVIVANSDPENISGTDYERVALVVYDGATWSTPADLTGQTGDTVGYTRPVLVVGASSRAHVWLFPVGGTDLLHVAIESDNSNGAIGIVDTLDLSSGWFYGLPASDGAEIIIPYLRDNGSPELAVARATSSAAPSWTIETVDGVNVPATSGAAAHSLCGLAWGDTGPIVYWITGSALYTSLYDGGWGTPTLGMSDDTLSVAGAVVTGDTLGVVLAFGTDLFSPLEYWEADIGGGGDIGLALYYSI